MCISLQRVPSVESCARPRDHTAVNVTTSSAASAPAPPAFNERGGEKTEQHQLSELPFNRTELRDFPNTLKQTCWRLSQRHLRSKI